MLLLLRPLSRTRSQWLLCPTSSISSRRFSNSSIRAKPETPAFTAPTCCSPTPAMPEGLEIDHKTNLNGTMAPYAEQVIICTGKDDWTSRIEDENSGDNLAADLKELIGRGGMYADPYNNIAIANSSFPSSRPERHDVQTTSAYLFPSFKYIPFLPRVSFDSVQALVKGYLQPKTLNPAHAALSPIHKDRLTRSEGQAKLLPGVKDVDELTILICGHGGRDMRCGIMGPVLKQEFERQLGLGKFRVLNRPVRTRDEEHEPDDELGENISAAETIARVGLISHIGGHKFAGNVIIYIPPRAAVMGKKHPLAGCGIWYGRVEPKHVDDILMATMKGMVIEALFRGGIRQGGEIIRSESLEGMYTGLGGKS